MEQTALAYARVWHHVDASDRILGKLAERIALVLMGKHKPIYDPSGALLFKLSLRTPLTAICFTVDCGDYVVVTNSRNIKVTGRKDQQLLFRKHSMFPGGLKETPYKDMMVKNPDEVRSMPPFTIDSINIHEIQIIRHAVSGMLPKNKLRDRRLERLYVFPSYRMGILGGNILRSWDDGTMPSDWDPKTPLLGKAPNNTESQ